MKNIFAASAVLMLLAGAATAADNQSRERPDPQGTSLTDVQKVEVKAGTIYSPKELVRAGLMANDLVEVSVLPTTNVVEMTGRDN